MKEYIAKYSAQNFDFYDLTAIVKKDWTVDFCGKLLDGKINLDWSLPSGTRSEALDEESLSLLAKTNCKYLVYAPESGSEETLKAIKKKIILKRMKRSVRTAIKNGIVVRTNLILGFPHETRKNILQTMKDQLEYAFMGVDDCTLSVFQPYPGSELFEELRAKGRIQLNDSYFDTLSSLSYGRFSLPDEIFCERVGNRELLFYKILGFFLFYVVSYLSRPLRILRTIKNVLFTDKSSTVFEQRIKDKLRRIKTAVSA